MPTASTGAQALCRQSVTSAFSLEPNEKAGAVSRSRLR